MQESILEMFLDFIARNFQIEKDEIDLEKSLIDEGVIDSFGLIEISGFIQNAFSITITDEEMTRDNFGSVLKIVDFVSRKTLHG